MLKSLGVFSEDYKKLRERIREFDLILWESLILLLKKNQVKALKRFNLSRNVYNILLSNPNKVHQLASGVLISFKIQHSDIDLPAVSRLSGISYLLHENFNYLDINYWMLLRELSKMNINMSMLTFGVPCKLAEWVSSASNELLYRIAIETSGNISLRYSNRMIQEIWDNRYSKEYFSFKKMMSLLRVV